MKGLAAVVLAALAATAAAGAGGGRAVYAELSRGATATLVRVDPATLRVLPGPRVPLGRSDGPWARSPDGALLAVGSGRVAHVRIVDLTRMRVVRDISVPSSTVALAWPAPDRIVAVTAAGCCPTPLRALALDSATGRVVGSSRLGSGQLVAASATPSGLVLLLAPSTRIGNARVALVAPTGAVRSVPLAGFPAGSRYPRPTATAPIARFATPALAVDPPGRHAYVIGHEPQVAEVDLSSFAVTVHGLPVRSLADGGISAGFYRRAVWAGDGVIALTGRDDAVEESDVPGVAPQQTSSAFGLRLIDTRTWTVRLVAERTTAVVRVAGGLLATGSVQPAGLSLFDLSGKRRWRALPKQGLDAVPVAAGHAYLWLRDRYDRHPVLIFDLATGRSTLVNVAGAITLLGEGAPHTCWC